ncbi:hypothetical protein JQN59_26375 (plasmid) [Citrobacter sp. B72]|uniref:hypothetical protein n=1 Tax=Citrobacter sp. B72 TaxID=2807631 RepID=UPI001959FCE3|nr:hypothetical protein [Citrobacter sp. B72]QRQ77040.1 hypothetical protein JQN59_26375 [Citrobacter sp. B72]
MNSFQLISKVLSVGIIVSLTVVGVNIYRSWQESAASTSVATCSLPTGNFKIIPRDGRLNAVNAETGMTLGVPVRHPDGKVLLVTHEGKVRDVTDCLGEKKGWFAPRGPDATDILHQ